MSSKLTGDEVSRRLEALDGWRGAGDAIRRDFEFDDFAQALAFVNEVGALAEAANHHPDITLGYGAASVSLTTHDVGGLSEKDFALAGQIDAIERG